MSHPKTDVNSLSPEDRKLYEEIEAKFLGFKLNKYKLRVIQEARLIHTDVLADRNNITDVKAAYAKFVEHMQSGKWMTAMVETEYVIYVDPEETKTSPETILDYQLLLGDVKSGTTKDYRIIGVEKCEDVCAHELMPEGKLRDSIENAFLDRLERMKEEAKIEKPERMN